MSGQTLDKLVYMANQIAREFSSQRPREAADATWDHLWHFWDLRMRAMILAHLREGGAGASTGASVVTPRSSRAPRRAAGRGRGRAWRRSR